MILIQPHELHIPSILNANIHDQECFATNDLLQPHPSVPGLWKVYGRANSQILLATGKKVTKILVFLRI
jgi:hypothetical protein